MKSTLDAIQEEVNNSLAFIAEDLPHLVSTDAASFDCGYNVGMKAALLSIDRLLQDYFEAYNEKDEGF